MSGERLHQIAEIYRPSAEKNQAMLKKRTTLTLEALTSIHATAKEIADREQVPPSSVSTRASEVVRERGRHWTETVLLRTLSPPTLFRAAPSRSRHEDQIIILADRAEWELLARNGDEERS